MISIDKIKLSDLVEYAALCEEVFAPTTNMQQLEKMVTAIHQNSSYILIGAKDENKRLLGSVMGITCMDTVGECQPFMVMENMVVSEQSRRQGVGEKLVRYIEEYARGQDCKYIMFTSLAKRKEAHLFYESIGYLKNITQGFKKYL